MKSYYKYTVILFVFLFGTLMMAEDITGEIVVFHAGSLSVPFAQIEKAFESQYPGTDVIREAAGSREAVRKVTDLGREADVIGSADYTVIENLMIPEYTEWYINFANNEMVIMYTEDSRYKDEINSDNWYEILLRPDVEYGHSDPNADPCGYRSQIVWKLAEKYYKVDSLYKKLADNCPPKNVRPKETDLIALLEAGELDYIFIYKSVALQHRMPYVELPEQINLKSTKYADFYATASFDVTGKEPGEMITQIGQPMVYALTIPNNAPNLQGAIAFIKFVIGPQGRAIMEENGQPSINPPEGVNIEKAPQELQDFLKGGAND
ncbi:molybdenum ABC transporter substrate-binding protein [Petrotoga sp. HWH.PT.55.6.1]|jgi:molybdate/tungstate transport system substrate-binding protein|uniref:tungstate ABC transporter substrate-binding protein WtpA n=1 Tax=unclassified Petrotoga TaxID=2620614 RepID=UPI000CA07811|nr:MULTISPECIES: tungstate ABC transporter substrate-binding protein WtpA [unclassified Petrotoga]PNR94211.1 ABC transporter substrate-binding protein [Petrotoga sp. HWHPT.55.6.3]RPD36345.1 molybdenum ABC transporter substrate-binding protein [Petrotoga sp. HWH.PT.55.6.1]